MGVTYKMSVKALVTILRQTISKGNITKIIIFALLHKRKRQYVVYEHTLAVRDCERYKVTFGAIINEWCSSDFG